MQRPRGHQLPDGRPLPAGEFEFGQERAARFDRLPAADEQPVRPADLPVRSAGSTADLAISAYSTTYAAKSVRRAA